MRPRGFFLCHTSDRNPPSGAPRIAIRPIMPVSSPALAYEIFIIRIIRLGSQTKTEEVMKTAMPSPR